MQSGHTEHFPPWGTKAQPLAKDAGWDQSFTVFLKERAAH